MNGYLSNRHSSLLFFLNLPVYPDPVSGSTRDVWHSCVVPELGSIWEPVEWWTHTCLSRACNSMLLLEIPSFQREENTLALTFLWAAECLEGSFADMPFVLFIISPMQTLSPCYSWGNKGIKHQGTAQSHRANQQQVVTAAKGWGLLPETSVPGHLQLRLLGAARTSPRASFDRDLLTTPVSLCINPPVCHVLRFSPPQALTLQVPKEVYKY